MRRLVAVVLLLAACGAPAPGLPEDGGSPPGSDAGPGRDGGPRPPFDPHHAFPPIALSAGEERLGDCQSWTLNNPTELWVNGIQMTADPGWHHSNWMFVPDIRFTGPDGTWPCRDRGFDEVAAAAVGAVFFAQSTQSTSEHQQFAPGAAYRIPPWSRVIGSVHVINFTGAPTSTHLEFTIEPIDAAAVVSRLRPLAIDDRGIDVAPRSSAEVTTACDFRSTLPAPPAFSVFYVLPHYHGRADGMRVSVFGGPNDGRVIFETTGGVGNQLGGPVTPPVSLAGAFGLRVSCRYTNPDGFAVGWGAGAADEMCTMLAYTDAERQLAGFADTIATRTTLPDGTPSQESPCTTVGLP